MEAFERELGKFLQELPDQPNRDGYVGAFGLSKTNSLTWSIPGKSFVSYSTPDNPAWDQRREDQALARERQARDQAAGVELTKSTKRQSQKY